MWISQSPSFEKSTLQLVKGLLGLIGPGKRRILTSQSRQRFGDSSKILHEAAVITGQTEKGTNIAQAVWSGPISDGIKLSRLRFNTVGKTKCPRNSMGDLKKTHLEGLAFRPYCRSLEKTASRRSISCSGPSAKTTMSSK